MVSFLQRREPGPGKAKPLSQGLESMTEPRPRTPDPRLQLRPGSAHSGGGRFSVAESCGCVVVWWGGISVLGTDVGVPRPDIKLDPAATSVKH